MAAQTPEPGAFPYPDGLRDLYVKEIEENISAAIKKLESIIPTTSLPPWKTENELYRSAYHYIISLEAVNGIYDLTPTPQSKPSSPRSECTYTASCGTRATAIPSSPSPMMINKEENRGDSTGRPRELGPKKRKVTDIEPDESLSSYQTTKRTYTHPTHSMRLRPRTRRR